MCLVSETPGSLSAGPIVVVYLFFEKFFLICRIFLEPISPLLPDDLLYITTKLGWVLPVAKSFLLLMAM